MSLLDFQFQSQPQFQRMSRSPSEVSKIEPIMESNRTAVAYNPEQPIFVRERGGFERAIENMSDDLNAHHRREGTIDRKLEQASISVTTTQELRRAIEQHCGTIIVTGELAENLQAASRITLLTLEALSGLEAACATLEARKWGAKIFPSINPDSPNVNIGFTGGPLGGMLVAASEATGFSLSLIRTIAAVGFGLILSLFEDYDVESSTDGGKLTLRFKLKRRKSE